MELEDELEALQQEKLDEELLQTGNVPVMDDVHKLPTVANAEPSRAKQPIEEDDEEAELRKLQAEMATS
jgi:charged multivesicular body protein 4